MGGDRGEAGVSLRLRLLNGVLRWAVKPRLAATKTPAQAEREFDRGARIVFRVPRGVRVAVRHVPGPARPVRVNRIAGRGAADDGLILHFHGGGYVAGSARTHLGMLARLSSSAGVPVDAPDYRLAEEAPAPAAFEDACAVWDALIRDGKEPARIVLGGDSAGGGIALALLAWLCARGTPPAGLYAFSPWADLTLSAVSLAENAVADPLLPGGRLGELVAVIRGRLPAEDPRVSPLFAAFPGPPPVLLQAGRTEILRDDTLRMAARLRAEGAEVRLRLWPDTPHVVQIFGGWLPEAREGRAEAAAFVRERLQTVAPARR
jgi:acetyl esterase/lipase